MRTSRYIAPRGGIYHVTAHTLDTADPFPLNAAEHERLVRLITPLSAFTGIRVLTYALMGNHFHLLLEVPKRPTHIPEAEVVRRLNKLPKASRAKQRPGDTLALRLRHQRELGMPEPILRDLLDKERARMFNLSRFMQELLSRFTQNYNRRHNRKGTLWDDRFHSTLVENSPKALAAVASYIDLNPYRAGLCDKSLRYRFNGYSAAAGGNRFALEGLRRLMALLKRRARPYKTQTLLRIYHNVINQRLQGLSSTPSPALKSGWRMRYFTSGRILGSKIFVENHRAAWRRKQHLVHTPTPVDIQGEGLYAVHPLRPPIGPRPAGGPA